MCSCLGVVFTLRLTLFVESSADLVPCSLCVGGSEQEGERFFWGVVLKSGLSFGSSTSCLVLKFFLRPNKRV